MLILCTKQPQTKKIQIRKFREILVSEWSDVSSGKYCARQTSEKTKKGPTIWRFVRISRASLYEGCAPYVTRRRGRLSHAKKREKT